MTWDIKSFIKLLISLLIGIGLVYYLQSSLSANDKNLIFESIKNAKIQYIIPVLILGFAACIIRALRWRMLLRSMDYNPRLSTLSSTIFIMYIANLIFPRLGEVLRCSLVQKYEKIPIEKSIGTMIVERLVDMLGMAIIALLALLFEYDKFLAIIENYQAAKGDSSMLIPTIGVLGLMIILVIAWSNEKIRNFTIEKLKGILDGLSSILKLSNPILFIAYSISLYFFYFLATYLMYFAITGTEHLSLSSALLILTAGTLGIGLTQGGIGAFQLLVSQSLSLYSIPKPIGLAYAWASWLVQTLNLIFFGILSWGYLLIRKDGKET